LINRQKVNLRQCVLAPVREDLLNGVDFDRKEQIKGEISSRDQRRRSETQRQEQIKGTDQRRNVRSRSKEPSRDATSGAVQRNRSETQRQGRSKEPSRDATSRADQRNQSEAQRQEEVNGVRLEQQPRSQQSEDQPR
jgi:hypothetical protein